MFKPINLSLGVLAPLLGAVGAAQLWNATPAFGGVTTAVACFVNPDGDAPFGQMNVKFVGGDDERVAVATAVEVPPVWIGVRLTEVPEPLAAHLGRGGLMVANVLVDGPADQAGLARYDVIVSCDGQPIAEMRELGGAIAAAGAGTAIELSVIHAGREQTVTITPAARDDAVTLEFKYEEPEDSDAEVRERYFGHRITRDPSGYWVFSPLGRMDLPDGVRRELDDINAPAWRDWIKDFRQFQAEPFSFRIEVNDDDDPLGGNVFFHGDNFDEHATIDIAVTKDDGAVHIHRDSDGTFEVTRTDADGNQSTQDYVDADTLNAQDPDAYSVFRRHTGVRLNEMLPAPPDWQSLPGQQRRFQEELRSKLEDTRQRMRDAAERSRRVRDRSAGSSVHVETGRSVSVTYDADNGWTVDIDDESGHRRFEFDDLGEFKRENPDVYKQYRKELEAAGGRTQLLTRWVPRA